MNILGRYKNGNYTVTIFDDGTKIVDSGKDDYFMAEFAESYDICITKKCDGGCKFCYENCSITGKHGDILNYSLLDSIHPYTEVAINGNDLSHPDLDTFLTYLYNRNVIVSMTVNQRHLIKYRDKIKSYIEKGLIKALGVSLVQANQELIDILKEFPNTVLHVIAGIITTEEIEILSNNNLKILILGYKKVGRGKDYYYLNKHTIESNLKYLSDNIQEIMGKFKIVSLDNLTISQLDIKSKFDKSVWDECYMGDDGEHSYYIDLVNKQFARNSMSPIRYKLLDNADDMFRIIKNT